MMSLPSGAGAARGTGIALRLLPHVHHPPATVLVPWTAGVAEALSLDARGYRVTIAGDRSPSPGIAAAGPGDGGPFDLVCETGGFAGLDATAQRAWLEQTARRLRPGGQVFGAFPGDAAGLLGAAGAWFDVVRLEPSALGDGDWLEAVLVRR